MRTRIMGSLTLGCLALLAATDARALVNLVFISARSGSDNNACDTITKPCLTFTGAAAKLNPGGEAIVLDSGSYGPVTVTKSLTIEAPPGVLAFIHAPSGDAVTINAGNTDVVVLRGLVLNGGPGDGIAVKAVGALYVESCVISGFSSAGIRFNSAGQLFLTDTISRHNAEGMDIFNGRVSIDHCRFEGNNGSGVVVLGANVTARNSVCAGNNGAGFYVYNTGSSNSVLNVYQCISANNNFGLKAFKFGSGFVIARVANSSISENGQHGLENGGAVFESLGNNLVRGNITGDVSGAITVVAGQ
jgi:hypothetical protein